MFQLHHGVLAAALLLASTTASAGEPVPPPAPASIQIPLDAAHRTGLPSHRALMNAHGQALDCTGVSLAELLQKAGAMPDGPLRGPQLARIVDVRAADGYRIVFSLAELEAGLGHTEVILADQCQGKPLDGHDGPLRLIVPGDSRPARSARQVERITVLTP